MLSDLEPTEPQDAAWAKTHSVNVDLYEFSYRRINELTWALHHLIRPIRVITFVPMKFLSRLPVTPSAFRGQRKKRLLNTSKHTASTH